MTFFSGQLVSESISFDNEPPDDSLGEILSVRLTCEALCSLIISNISYSDDDDEDKEPMFSLFFLVSFFWCPRFFVMWVYSSSNFINV